MAIRTIIRSTGRFTPKNVITNKDMTQWMDTTDEWIQQRTGIETRRWVDKKDGVGPSDLALEASKIALDRAGWKATDLDLIIFATLSPDMLFPGSGCLLQEKLGLETTPALDIRQQCTGFIYGLATADAYMKAGMMKKILFVGAEVHSAGLDITTRGRDVAVLFGDGAAAVCLEGVETNENVGILSHSLHSQGKYATQLFTEGQSFRLWPSIKKEMLDEARQYPKMEGSAVFKHATRRMPEAAAEVLEKAGLKVSDIDLLIPHQANLRINQMVQKGLGLPDEKVFNNIMRYGNTTAASIPLALDEAYELGKVPKKATLLFVAFGAGFTWGGIAYRSPV
ncbi:MAG TPA: beta-ketoacyl-ACP synthase III [Bdellovibrionota bacterium]|jgi:3-oxoacyl-[acyl-carrier-protein] synthase-3